jgi:hypothetical protein
LLKVGYELDDIGGALSWGALDSFIRNLSLNSATMRELNPELARWDTQLQTNAILADIYDMLAALNYNVLCMASKQKPQQPKPYPRPNQKEDDNRKKIGKGALPVAELSEWFEQRRKKYAERNDRSRPCDSHDHPEYAGSPAEDSE